MFDKEGLMNEADKLKRMHALADRPNMHAAILTEKPQGTRYVIDGGSLLQRIPWVVRMTFGTIFDSYINYLLKHYGSKDNITVVFDGGYLEPSTKDTTHLRRSKGKLGRLIKPALSNSLFVKKGDFLLNNDNKQVVLITARATDYKCRYRC